MHRQKGWKRVKAGEQRYVFKCLSNDRKARGSCESFMVQEGDVKDTLLTMIQVQADIIIGNSLKLRKHSAKTDAMRDKTKNELTALRLESDKDVRMFKSLYESLINGIITPDEYKEMRESYDTKMQNNLARSAELTKTLGELDNQIAEYLELSDLIVNADNVGITAKVIESLVGKIKFFSDKSIEVDFLFDKGFDLVNEVCGLNGFESSSKVGKIDSKGRYDIAEKGAAANG